MKGNTKRCRWNPPMAVWCATGAAVVDWGHWLDNMPITFDAIYFLEMYPIFVCSSKVLYCLQYFFHSWISTRYQYLPLSSLPLSRLRTKSNNFIWARDKPKNGIIWSMFKDVLWMPNLTFKYPTDFSNQLLSCYLLLHHNYFWL